MVDWGTGVALSLKTASTDVIVGKPRLVTTNTWFCDVSAPVISTESSAGDTGLAVSVQKEAGGAGQVEMLRNSLAPAVSGTTR